MRVGKAKEDAGELAAAEEVGEEFHGVGAEAGDVLVEGCVGVLVAEGLDAVLDKGGDLGADFHSWGFDQGVRKSGARLEFAP